MNRYVAIASVGAALGACADRSGDEPTRHTEAFKHGPFAEIAITAEPGGSCERACFDVQSGKGIGFIAVDSVGCGDAPVDWALTSLASDGTRTPLSITPTAYGQGKACSGVPADALKFDDLDGRHVEVCATGARQVDLFVKSAKTCSGASFDMTPPPLDVHASIDPQGCNLTTFYEVLDVTGADGSLLPFGSYTCHWTFDDGGTSDACGGNYTFSAPGFHGAEVTVTESDTGAAGTDTVAPRPIWDVLAIELVATAPSCGLSFDYAITKTGGKPTGGLNFLSVTPWENVVDPPSPGGTNTGTVQVTAPGTYTVTAYREEETSFSLCNASDTTEVTVSACP